MWYLFCDECRSRRNDLPAIWKSLPIPALRFASSVSIIHKQNRYSDTASLIFSRRSSRKHGEFSIDPLIAVRGRRGTSANQMAALSPPWWWTASTSDVQVSDGLAVSLSQSVRAAMRRSRRRPHRYLVLIYFCRLWCLCLQIAFSSARLIKFDSSFWLKGSRNKTNSTFDV